MSRLLVIAAVVAHFHCAYGIQRLDGEKLSGFTGRPHVSAPQQYPSERTHGRQLNSATAFQPIRIKVETVSLDGLTDSMQTWLQDTLVSSAVATLQQALSVVPVSGALLADRQCTSTWQVADSTCASADAPTCGILSDGNEQTIPDSMLRGLRTCSTCFSNTAAQTCMESAGSTCSTSASGAGAANTDFLLYVSSVNTAACSGGTLAYAWQCIRDQYDRPVVGYANFCPSAVSSASSAWDKQYATAVHEILHALGFASDSWALFRYADGTPRTPRDSSGLPAQVSATCTDGTTQTIRAPSSNTLAVATVNGIVTNTLVTPRVVSVARDIFGCATLSGGRLENQPTSSGSCYGSHWEQRYFMNEMMASTSSHHAAFSPMTLAAMEDSGWYKANYSVATGLIWGRNRGCGFVTGECVDGGTAADGFCHVESETGCTPDHRAKGYCNLRSDLTSIPSQFQHFDGETNKGGQLEVADYCPYVMAYSNGDCSIASNAMSTDYGETYGEASSMCFQNTLVQSGFVASAANYGCYETRCQGGVLEVKVSNM